jgi:5-formyltetrahydrofolate cyclo-ligase
MSLEKDEIRRKFRKLRSNLTPHQRKVKSREIVRNSFGNFKLPKSYIIAGYTPRGSEVDISLLLELYEEAGNRICLPVVVENKSPMVFKEHKKGWKLIENNQFGFLEPANTEELIPDLIITPLIAFDAARNRLGQGGGFYDRTFDYLSGFKDFLAVGIGFAIQQADFLKPDKFDYTLDAIVTEERVII